MKERQYQSPESQSSKRLDDIFAVVRFDGDRRYNAQTILTTCLTKEELTQYYAGLIQEHRKKIASFCPVEIRDGLTLILNDVQYDAFELAKKHKMERRPIN